MATSLQIKIHLKSTNQDQLIELKSGQAVRVAVHDVDRVELLDSDTGLGPRAIETRRLGNDLVIHSEQDVADVVLEGFYDDATTPELLGMGQDGQFYQYLPQDGQLTSYAANLNDGGFAIQGLAGEAAGAAVGVAAVQPVLATLAGAAAGAAALASDASKPVVDVPEVGGMRDSDGDGFPEVSGTAIPGSTVTVKAPDGSTFTSVTDASGNYTVETDGLGPLTGTYSVTTTDSTGNTSDPATIPVDDSTDLTAPAVPGDTGIHDTDGDGNPNLTGTAEPGSTITATAPDGQTFTGVADSSGNYNIDTSGVNPLTGTYSVTSTDGNGNTSAPATIPVDGSTDLTAPDVPGDTGIHDTDGDGNPNLTGTAEPGSTITATAPDGQTFTGTADSSGNYDINMPGVSPVTGTYSVTSTDGDGNTSQPATIPADSGTDLTAPDVPGDTGIHDTDGDGNPNLTGTAEPGSTITATAPDGQTFTGTADSSGNYDINMPGVSPVTGTYSVTSTDGGGNTSTPATIPVDGSTDLSAPATPNVPTIIDSDGDGKPDVTGTGAEPGSTVTVTAPDGTTTFTTIADSNGNYTVEGPSGLNPLTGTYSVTSTDGSGNTSAPATVQPTDLTAPTEPGDTAIHDTDGDTHPNLTGTAEPGSTITATAPDGQTFTGTADSNGDYNINMPGVSPVTGTYSVTSTDGAGNTSTPATIPVDGSTDLTAPTQPNVPTVVDTDGDGKPDVTGTGAEPNSTVTVTAPDGTTTFTTVADSNGNYTVEGPSGLNPLTGTYSVTSTDSSGNTSTAATKEPTDLTAPGASVTGLADTDGDNKPDVSGTAEAGSTVVVTAPDGVTTFTTVADASGNYSVEGPSGLSPLTGTYSVTATDAAGNTSVTQTIGSGDLTAPVISFNTVATDDVVNAAEKTASVTIAGTTDAEAGQQIEVSWGGATFTASVQGDGTWSVTVAAADVPADAASTTISAVVSDLAGNTSLSTTHNVGVDTVAPTVAITTPLTDGATVSGDADGVLNADEKTAIDTATTWTVNGTTAGAEENQVLTLSLNNHNYTTSVQADGSWSVDVASADVDALAHGNTYTLSATVKDAAGNPAVVSTQDLEIRLAPPDTPTVTLLNTNTLAPTVSGLAQKESGTTPGTYIGLESGDAFDVVLNGNTYSYTVGGGSNSPALSYDAGTGAWTLVVPNGDITAEGVYDVAVSINAVGYATSKDDISSDELVIKTTLPTVTLNTVATDNQINIAEHGQSLSLSGTIEDFIPGTTTNTAVGRTVNISLNGNTYPATINPDGTWSVLVSAADMSALSEGSATVQVDYTSVYGNTNQASQALTVDLTAPTTPGLDNIATDNIIDAAESAAGFDVTGTAEAGSTVTVTLSSGATYTTVADSNGDWAVPMTSTDVNAMGQGAERITVYTTDATGNTSGQSFKDIVVDSLVPDAPGITTIKDIDGDGKPDIVGTAEAGSTVTVTAPDGVTTFTTTADSNGNYTVEGPAGLNPLTGTYSVTATDASGNSSTASTVVPTDLTAPTQPNVPTVSDTDGDGKPDVTGTGAEPGSTVTVTAPDGTTTFTTIADSNGNYTVEGPSGLNPLTGTYSVTSTDGDGNTSSPATVQPTDLTAPTQPNVPTVSDTDGDGKPDVTGTGAEPGSTVTVTAPDGTTTFTTIADSNGNYTVEGPSGLNPLTGTYSVTSTDGDGNTSSPATVQPTDLTAPVAPGTPTIADTDGDGRPDVTGTAEPNSTVTVTAPDGTTTFTTIADSNGNYTVEGPSGLNPLTGTYSATSTDGGGNTSSPATVQPTDLTAPGLSVTDVIDTDGDGNPEISGTAEAGSTVVVHAPDGTTFTVVADSNGAYSLEMSGLSAGATTGTYSVTSTDGAGNTSAVATQSETDATSSSVSITGVADVDGDGKPDVTGTAEAGSTVTVTAPDGVTTFTTVADSNGNYTVEGPSGLYPLTGTYSVSSVDGSGNTSGVSTQGVSDLTAPSLTLVSPGDESFVSQDGSVVVTFSESIALGSSGTITFLNQSGGSNVVIDLAAVGGQLSVSGNQLTITPTGGLAASSIYALTVDAGAITDTAGNGFVGISDTTAYNFYTANSSGGIDLSTVSAGIQGFTILGDGVGTNFDYDVSNVGDFNGDGLDDVVVGVGAYGADTGTTYIVFGKGTGDAVDVSATDAQSLKITGLSGGSLGWEVSEAGDFNGDGLADVVISDLQKTKSYVVFGSSDLSDIDLSASNTGRWLELAGHNISVSGAADINGDGYSDLVVGSDSNKKAYVVFGGNTSGIASGSIDLATLAANSAGFEVTGPTTVGFGRRITALGDINGDQLADFAVGEYTDSSSAGVSGNGHVYVVYGKTDTTTVQTSDIVSGQGGFVINGAALGDWQGIGVANAGDFNGDGFADVLTSSNGKAYLVYGSSTGATVEISDIDAGGSQGVYIEGISGAYSMSDAGDINGDGLSDILMANRLATVGSDTNAGKAYVIFGRTDGATIHASDIEAGTGGFVLNGETATDQLRFVSSAGDVNGDGYDDLIVGAQGSAGLAGRAYVVFGGPVWTSGTAVNGSGAVTGSTGSEVVLGSDQADTLTGGGGTDRFYAGAGDDVIVLSATDVTALSSGVDANGDLAAVDGGTGIDTIRLSGGAALNLRNIGNAGATAQEASSRIRSVEVVDLSTDTATNVLTITAQDVADMAGFNVFNDGNGWSGLGASVNKHQVRVDASSNDVVTLLSGDGWTTSSTATFNGTTYNVYERAGGAEQLLLAQGVMILTQDTTPPAAPTTTVADTDGDNKPDVSGTAEAGSTVTVTAPDGVTTFTTVADSSGNYSVEGPSGLNPLTGTYSVTATDAAGNTSTPATVNQSDLTPPSVGTPLVTDANSNNVPEVSGTAEAGSTVTITAPDGTTTYTVVADSNGDYNLELVGVSGVMGTYSVTATDAAGNVSAPASRSVNELTPPVLDLDSTAGSAASYSQAVGSDATVVYSLDNNAAPATVTEASDAISSVSVSFSGLQDGANEKLVVDTTDIAADGSVTSGSVTVNGTAWTWAYADGAFTFTAASTVTNAVAEDLIHALGWRDTAGVFTQAVRQATITLTDGSGNTSTGVTSSLIAGDAPAPSATSLNADRVGNGNLLLDFNGDGFADLTSGDWVGGCYQRVWLGSATGNSTTPTDIGIDRATLQSGQSNLSATAMDFNGDGYMDIHVGDQSFAGQEIIFGNADGLTRSTGTTIDTLWTGAQATNQQITAKYTGDFNGDGYDDLFVSNEAGYAAIRYGNAAKDNSYNSADATKGILFSGSGINATSFALVSSNYYYHHQTAATYLDDVNQDGLSDVAFSNWKDGTVFVKFGTATQTSTQVIDASTVGAATGNGWMISGFSGTELDNGLNYWDLSNKAGLNISAAGDVNGDGIGDLLAVDSGARNVYVIYGQAPGAVVDINVATLTASQGFKITTTQTTWDFGWNGSSAGDMNGDGFDDIVIAAPTMTSTGGAIVVFGGASGAHGDLTVDSVATSGGWANLIDFAGYTDGVNPVKTMGEFLGSAPADVNGDGLSDFSIGSNLTNDALSVIYGGTDMFVLGATGYATGSNVSGGGSADKILGTTGADTLSGGGGADAINSGAGNDAITVGDANFLRVDGGGNVDTLYLGGDAITLNLTTLGTKVQSIENVDLTGTGNNTLTLTTQDVLHQSSSVDLAATTGINEAHTLVISGDAGDVLNVDQTNGANAGTWTSQGALAGADQTAMEAAGFHFVSGHTYTLHTNGIAALIVDDAITHNVI